MALFKRENNISTEKEKGINSGQSISTQDCQPEYDIRQAYSLLYDILKLKPIRSLAVILLTAKVLESK